MRLLNLKKSAAVGVSATRSRSLSQNRRVSKACSLYLAALTVFLCLCSCIPVQATTLTGSVKRPDGTGVTGQLRIRLSQPAAQLSTGGCGGPAVLVPSVEVVFTITNGTLGTATIVGTDCLSPTGVYYVARVIDSNGNILSTDNWCSVTGASVDIGTLASCAVPTGTSTYTNLMANLLTATTANIGTIGGNPNFTGTPTFPSGATITNGTFTNGTLSGTFSGSPTLSGNLNFTGTPSFSAGALSGTYSGNPTFSGTPVFNNSFNVASSPVATTASTTTFLNKTTTGAGSGNNMTLLDRSGPQSALTGDSTDKTAYTYTVPANTMQAAKGVVAHCFFRHTTGTASINWKANFGATVTTGFGYDGAQGVEFDIYVFNTTAQTNQVMVQRGSGYVAAVTVGAHLVATPAENTANAIVLKLTFNVANTNQVTQDLCYTELIQ